MNKKFKVLTPVIAVMVVASAITTAVLVSPQVIKTNIDKNNKPIKIFGEHRNVELKTNNDKVEKVLNSENNNETVANNSANTTNLISTNIAVNQPYKNSEWYLNNKFWEKLDFDFIGAVNDKKSTENSTKTELKEAKPNTEAKNNPWYLNTKFWENLGFDFIASDAKAYKTSPKAEIEKIKKIIEKKENEIDSVNEKSPETVKEKEKTVDDLEAMLKELDNRLFGSFRDAVIAKEKIDKEISELEKENKDTNKEKLNEFINKRKEAGEKLTKENDEYFAHKKLIEELQEKLKKIKQK
ncbi:hypothetical protein MBOVa_3950 [Mycoplasmopsis bovis 8790]|nr:hypothetical protein MBOVa_3950 [Mycoplasmopsis bovis 8790]